MTEKTFSISSLDYDQMVRVVCQVAKAGLSCYYNELPLRLPYTTRRNVQIYWNLTGDSIRYAAISQIGINRWRIFHPEDDSVLPDVWPAIMARFKDIQDIGDIALCLWAGIDSEKKNLEVYARLLGDFWPKQKHLCNAVELGWIVQAGTLCIAKSGQDIENLVRPILNEAQGMLKKLYHPQSSLFQRCSRGGRLSIKRRVACFADQVYPVLALTTYGQTFDDSWSKECAASVVDSICRHQGSLGQWMWHYDTEKGKVCETYPVFSVHQDGMAPMAILASDRTCGTNHTKCIELGMRWLFGENELRQNLVFQEEGIIWRDIERKEPQKMSRFIRGLCCVLGIGCLNQCLDKLHFGFKINYECRPYHLGWVLYAWADYKVQTRKGSGQ